MKREAWTQQSCKSARKQPHSHCIQTLLMFRVKGFLWKQTADQATWTSTSLPSCGWKECVWCQGHPTNPTQVTQEADQSYGQCKSTFRLNLRMLLMQCQPWRKPVILTDLVLFVFGGTNKVAGCRIKNTFGSSLKIRRNPLSAEMNDASAWSIGVSCRVAMTIVTTIAHIVPNRTKRLLVICDGWVLFPFVT